MSAPFTTIAPGVELRVLLLELMLALRERTAIAKKAIQRGGGIDYFPASLLPKDPLWPNTDRGVCSWGFAQQMVEDMVVRYSSGTPFWNTTAGFVNPSTHLGWGVGETAALTAFFDYCSFSGTGTNRWRRLQEWDGSASPTYLYGKAQKGDIIGPWVIEDMQRAMGGMTCCGHVHNDSFITSTTHQWLEKDGTTSWPSVWSPIAYEFNAWQTWDIDAGSQSHRQKITMQFKSSPFTVEDVVIAFTSVWAGAVLWDGGYPAYYHDYAGLGASGDLLALPVTSAPWDFCSSADTRPDPSPAGSVWFQTVLPSLVTFDLDFTNK